MIFLGGLPRSGNTVLSALLNQNPNIYCSPLSPLREMLLFLCRNKSGIAAETLTNESVNAKYLNSLIVLANAFYGDIKKPIIIDRNKLWGNRESNFIMYSFFNTEPKLIFTTRDVKSIVTSFLQLRYADGSQYPDYELANEEEKVLDDDVRVEWLLRKDGQIDSCLQTLQDVKANKYLKVLFISYDELMNDNQTVMATIDMFLNLPPFEYNFENIVLDEESNDTILNLPPGLHTVRKQLKKISQEPSQVLSEKALKLCESKEL